MGYKLIWNDDVFKEIVKGSERAVGLGCSELLNRANEHVPHDEGTLERSGDVRVVNPYQGVVFYNTPYAVKLHEHPEYKFQGKGEGKWLEKAAKDKRNRDEIGRFIQKEFKQIFK